MKVLIISRDEGFLAEEEDSAEDLVARHRLYAERLALRHPGSEIRILVLARNATTTTAWTARGPLKVAGLGLRGLDGYVALAGLGVGRSRFFRHWRADLVTAQTPLEDGVLGLMLARRWRARFLAQAHFEVEQVDGPHHPPWRALRWRLAGWTIKRADAVRFVSPHQAAGFSERYALEGLTTYVLPVAMTIATARGEAAENRDPIVLYAGRFVTEKNLAAWVEVASRVANAVPAAQFHLVGDGPTRPAIEAAIHRHGLAPRVLIRGFVPPTTLVQVMRRASVFLLTSDKESFGRVLAEAGAQALPVVSTACDGPRQIVVDGQTGFIRDIGDIEGLAHDAIRLLEDRDLNRRIGLAAETRMLAEYAPEILADRIVDAWLETAGVHA